MNRPRPHPTDCKCNGCNVLVGSIVFAPDTSPRWYRALREPIPIDVDELIAAGRALVKEYDSVPMYGMLEDEVERLRGALPK